MDLVTTHLGADFDALGAMLGVRYLHPEAELFFPGSREESVRRMLASGLVDLADRRRHEIDPAAIGRLILCDSRQRSRLGVVADWIEQRPGIEVLAYDHHPPSPDDLTVVGGRIDPEVGATSTLITELLAADHLVPTTAESTLLLMGIYEDTGSLSYATTSARDLRAVAHLLESGGDLSLVRRFVLRELDSRHIALLNRMIEAMELHRIEGHRVGIAALETAGYVEEAAPLVSRCLELFDLPVIVALLAEGERVSVIARGRLEGADLGRLVARVGEGGGHATAAAGSVRGASLLEVRESVLRELPAALPPVARAGDVMIRHFHVLVGELTVDEAKDLLNRWRVNAAPVVEAPGQSVVGTVTRQLLDAALQHGLGSRPVASIADRNVAWARPDATLADVGAALLAGPSRFVLIGESEHRRAVGLVTRMDVLRRLHDRPEGLPGSGQPAAPGAGRSTADAAGLVRRLSAAVRTNVEAAAQVAREQKIAVYLVGGIVRDLLLGRDNRDVDLVVEGDGPDFARRLGEVLGARVRVHEEFLTAVVILPNGSRLDVATARSEFYRAPAALPEVTTSALRQDLYRRDFTINTLAIRLGPEPDPMLIDFFGARRDLESRQLRVLHSLSFIDDPTRALRAVRLEQRLGLGLSPESRRLLAVALEEEVFARLSGGRLREELELLLGDPAIVERAVERLADLGLLRVIVPELALDAATRRCLRTAVAADDWFRLQGLAKPEVATWRLALIALTAELPLGARSRLADRLALAGAGRHLLLEGPTRVSEARRLLSTEGVRPHRVVERLDRLAGEELLLLLAGEPPGVRSWVRRYLEELRPLRLSIRGADLLAHGVESGPALGRALAATRRARLDGEIDASGELAFALAAVAEESAVEGLPPSLQEEA